MTRLFFIVCAVLISVKSFAHSDGEDYIFVSIKKDGMQGEFHINVEDIHPVLLPDSPVPEELNLESVMPKTAMLHEFIRQGFSISPPSGDPYTLLMGAPTVLSEGSEFLVVPFEVRDSEITERLEISHNLFHGDDSLHRGLLLVQYVEHTDTDYGAERTALIFGPGKEVQTLDLNDIPGLISRNSMIYQGMLHIWAGLDHILFLFALILPTVLTRSESGLVPVQTFSRSFKSLLGIVTVFTVAHSITLLLAMLDLVSINDRLVESIIALSIALAALNNIFQIMTRGALWVVLLLGLFHGLGFASVMSDLPFRMENLAGMVFRFNVGVEIGQVAIVTVVFPLLYALRRQPIYQPLILKGGSWILVAISGFWFFQRALDL